jgi:hypothetical protein
MQGSLSRISLRSSGLHRSTSLPGAHWCRGTMDACSNVTAARGGRHFSNRSPHERSDMRGSLSRISLRSSGLHRSTSFAGGHSCRGTMDARSIVIAGRGARHFSNRSPHERSHMRGSLSRISLRSSGLHRSTSFAGGAFVPRDHGRTFQRDGCAWSTTFQQP